MRGPLVELIVSQALGPIGRHPVNEDLVLPEVQVSELGKDETSDDDDRAGIGEDFGGVVEEWADHNPFGLNDTSNPIGKAARLHMAKQAAIEPSGITDPQNGGEIFVSTTARIMFRKTFPDWAKIRNKLLNEVIAKAFAQGEPHQYFKPKKGTGNEVGEVRLYGSTKYIGIIMGSDVRIIAVKGTLPNIGKPPVQTGPGAAPSGAGGLQVQQLGETLKGAT